MAYDKHRNPKFETKRRQASIKDTRTGGAVAKLATNKFQHLICRLIQVGSIDLESGVASCGEVMKKVTEVFVFSVTTLWQDLHI